MEQTGRFRAGAAGVVFLLATSLVGGAMGGEHGREAERMRMVRDQIEAAIRDRSKPVGPETPPEKKKK